MFAVAWRLHGVDPLTSPPRWRLGSGPRRLGGALLGTSAGLYISLHAARAASEPLPDGSSVSAESSVSVDDSAATESSVSVDDSAAAESSVSEVAELTAEEPAPLHATELVAPHGPSSSADVAKGVRVGAVGILLMQSAIAPGWSLDSGFGLSVDYPISGLQPWFLLGVYFGTGKDVLSADGNATARFDHWAVYALGCPWRFDGGSVVGLRPCVDFDVGRSSGEGLGVASEVQSSAPWLSAGVQLRAEVELWERLQIGLSAGGFVPLLHSSFTFAPEDTTFEVPPVGFRAGGFGSVLF